MSAEIKLKAKLSSLLPDSKVYPLVKKDIGDGTDNFLTYTKLGREKGYTQNGLVNKTKYYFQIDVFSPTYESVKSKEVILMNGLDGKSDTFYFCSVVNVRDFKETLYRVSIDLMIFDD